MNQHKRDQLERIAQEEDITKDWCCTAVSTYTENTLDEGHTPTYDGFLKEYPEFDQECFIDVIEAEMKSVTDMCKKEELAG